jgi:acetyltransferase
VAVIGATERPDAVGRTVFENILAGSPRSAVYPVNPQRSEVLGVKAFKTIGAVPGRVDLAVIVTPAEAVPGIVAECVQAGVRCAVIISAGFKECGPHGVELERLILANAQGRMRIVGPNCLGVIVPRVGLNATFAATMARPGSVGFLSQSGALCTAILDWSLGQNVGFSAFVSLGSMLDVGWGDLIDHLGHDPYTKSIVIYMESIGDARSFLSAAREVALTKPIILIKVGRTAQAAKAAASHTGSLTGNDDVLSAAFRRAGVLRVNAISELFDMAEVLGKQPRPRGPRLAIVTNAGGPGALATDQLITDGGKIAELSPETATGLNDLLPAFWSHNNPVDILGDAGAERYAKATALIQKDAANDGVLVILTPQAMTDAKAIAERISAFSKLDGKPVLASWMGGARVKEGETVLNAAGIPTYEYPDTAARVFCSMWRYSDNLRALYETPSLAPQSQLTVANRALAAQLVEAARKCGRAILTEVEAKDILEAYGIPVVKTRVALSEKEAVILANELDGPAVLKVWSDAITHKSDVGGVKLDLCGSEAVRRAWREIKESVSAKRRPEDFLGVTVQPMVPSHGGYELILGSSVDPQFGPVLLFGAGGQLVELWKDKALGLPPLNTTLARRLMEQTRIYTALKGVRGRKAVDLDALEQLLVRFSHLVAEQLWIAESDINPLLASAEGLLALDARIIAHGSEVPCPPRLAIRPYPAQYIKPCELADGTPVTIRPIRPEDELLMVKFHKALGESSVRYRYQAMLSLDDRIAHERLTRICFNDYDREITLVAEQKMPDSDEHEILGVASLSKLYGLQEAEFALVIADRWQEKRLGVRLLQWLLEIGCAEKCGRVIGYIARDNLRMQHLAKEVGFTLRLDNDQYEAEFLCTSTGLESADGAVRKAAN